MADAEAGFGGVLNAFELMKAMIEAGAAGVHFEDQLASVKKCGHMGGKVLVPTREAVEKFVAARLAADVMGVPTLLVARTDAEAADLSPPTSTPTTSRSAPASARWGLLQDQNGLDQAISRGLAYALRRPGVVRDQQAGPRLRQRFADAIRQFPGCCAYNCSPSLQLEEEPRRRHHRQVPEEIASYGYKFQWFALAGFHSLQLFHVQPGARLRAAPDDTFVELQGGIRRRRQRTAAVKHQREVGTGYFDAAP